MEAELAVLDIELPPTVDELITEDGEPLESDWHRLQISLLVDSLTQHWADRTDYFAGGNMFVYYSMEQVRRRNYRGPDFFVALDVEGTHLRKAWVAWEEGGRYPNVIIELLSPTTANADLTTKKDLYEKVFQTSDYFCYDPDTAQFLGWTLLNQYVALEPNEHGWRWSRRLGLWLGLWEGEYLKKRAVWLRFYDTEGKLVLTKDEAADQRAETERQRAETERRRAEQAQAENERLRARLRELGVDPDGVL